MQTRTPLSPPSISSRRAGWLGNSIARALLAGLTILLSLTLLGIYTVQIVLEMRTTAGQSAELYFAGDGQGYEELRKAAFPVVPDGIWHTYRVRLPYVQELARLRIDPAPAKGDVAVRRVVVRTRHGTVTLQGAALRRAVAQTHDVAAQPVRQGIGYTSGAEDPYIDLALPPAASYLSLPGVAIFGHGLLWGTAGVVAWLMLELLGRAILGWVNRRPELVRASQTAADALSDDGVLRVDLRLLLTLAAIACGFVVYVALDLNQSSIGIWERMYPPRPVEQLIDLGTPRGTRADEWNVHTPWIFSQVLRGSDVHNLNVGGESAPLLASLPVDHPAGLAIFKFFGFRLFDLETGFSWFWAYKTFVLWGSFLWLLLVLTRGDLAVAALGSLWIYSSSYMQWWFSSGFTDILSHAALTIVGALYLLFAQRVRGIVLGAAIASYGVCNLLLQLYPPLLVPMAYIGILLVAGAVVEIGSASPVRVKWRIRVIAATGGLVVIALMGGAYAHDAWSTVATMRATVYPGARLSSSGAIPMSTLFLGFFENYRYDESLLPFGPGSNACEISSFMLLAPALLLALPWRSVRSRGLGLSLALGLATTLVGSWMAVALPPWLEQLYRRAGWGLVPPIRAIGALGVASILLVCVVAAGIRAQRWVVPRWKRLLIPALVAGALLLFGAELHRRDPIFFNWKTVMAGTLAASLIASGAVLGRLQLMLLGLALSSLPQLRANPLVSGISALSEKPLLQQIRAASSGPSDKWAVFGDHVLAQGMKAHGLNVVNGSHYVPNRQLAKVLDPEQASREVWNRYAHVVFQAVPGATPPRYTLVAPDCYIVTFDVCGPELPALGVTHVAYAHPVHKADRRRCLTPIALREKAGVEVFELKAPRSTDP